MSNDSNQAEMHSLINKVVKQKRVSPFDTIVFVSKLRRLLGVENKLPTGLLTVGQMNKII